MPVKKLYGKGIGLVATVRRERCNMAIMPNYNEMKQGDIDFQFMENVATVKWFDPSTNSS